MEGRDVVAIMLKLFNACVVVWLAQLGMNSFLLPQWLKVQLYFID
jgi:hypothetical protein